MYCDSLSLSLPVCLSVYLLKHHKMNVSLIQFSAHSEQMCIRELRERVAKGGDPTKLHEEPVQHDDSNVEQGILAIFPIMRLWKYLSVSCIVTAVVA
jgi:hypothetical protein